MSISSNITANLASTLFQGNAQDVIATPDVYGITNTNVINSAVGKFNPFDASMLNNLKSMTGLGLGGLIHGGSLSGVLNKALGINSGTIASLTSRVSSTLGVSLTSLPSNLQSSITRSIRSSAGNYSSLGVTVGSVTQQISSVDIAGSTSAFGLLNSATGNGRFASVTDIGASSTVLAGGLQNLISSGMGNTIPSVISSVGSSSVANAALAQCVPTAIEHSDLGTLSYITSALGSPGVLAAAPNAGRQLLSSYSLPSGTPLSQHAALGSQMSGLLNQLSPGWDTYSRNGIPSPSLASFAVASPDTLTVLGTNTKYTDHVYLAKALHLSNAVVSNVAMAVPNPLSPSNGNYTHTYDAISDIKSQFPFMLVS